MCNKDLTQLDTKGCVLQEAAPQLGSEGGEAGVLKPGQGAGERVELSGRGPLLARRSKYFEVGVGGSVQPDEGDRDPLPSC